MFQMGGQFCLFTFIVDFRVSEQICQGLNMRVLINWVINTRAEGRSEEAAMTLTHDFIFILKHKKVNDILYNKFRVSKRSLYTELMHY